MKFEIKLYFNLILLHVKWTNMDKKSKYEAFYGITDVADKLKLSQKTVRRHIASGKLQSLKIGGVHRIPYTSLKDFIHHNLNEPVQMYYKLFGKNVFVNDE